MTRSAVRSRLAPPSFACFASYGSASHSRPSGRSKRRMSRRGPKGVGGPGMFRKLFHCFASYGSASHSRPSGRSKRRMSRRSPKGVGGPGMFRKHFNCFASDGSASHSRPSGRSRRRMSRRSPKGVGGPRHSAEESQNQLTRRNCNLATAPAINPRGNRRSSSGTILMPRPGSTMRLPAINPR
jgi:hypothetical protein